MRDDGPCKPRACCATGCCSLVGRRDFLAGLGLLGGSALARHWGLFDAAVGQVLGATPKPGQAKQPLIRAAFTRQAGDQYYMGWPGAAYDIAASQRRYTEVLNQWAARLGVKLEIVQEPLTDDAAVDAFLEATAAANSDGVVLTVMGLYPCGWAQVDRFLEKREELPPGLAQIFNREYALIDRFREKRGNLPTIVFAPLGTQFTSTLQKYRTMPRVFVGATPDLEWLGTALRMLKTIWQLAHTRIAMFHGEQEREEKLAPLGTILHHIPLERFAEAYEGAANAAAARDIAAQYRKQARRIVEPDEREILEAARVYVVNRQLMDSYGCQAITMDCLGLVENKRMPPPCMAYMQLLNEGTCGACGCDINAALSLLLSSFLLDRPAFMHNPAPNTVLNRYGGAHCTAPTKMDGFDAPASEYLLRSHHESDWGVAPQVLLREGQEVTMMKFFDSSELMVCTGTLIRNIDTRPDDGVGGCRTAFEMSVDGVADALDVRGIHNVLIYGKHIPLLRAYTQLAGLAISHITGGPI